MKYWISLSSLVVILLFSACQGNKPQEDCDWEKIPVKATVVEIKELGNDKFEVMMDFDASKFALKPQKLSELKELEITSEFIKKNSLKVGNIYSGTVSELSQGDEEKCRGVYVSFNSIRD